MIQNNRKKRRVTEQRLAMKKALEFPQTPETENESNEKN